MHRKWMLVSVGVVAVAGVLVTGQLLMNRASSTNKAKPAVPVTQEATPPLGGADEPTTSAGVPGVIAPLPGGKPLAPIEPTGPARPGLRLHPLSTAPRGLVAGLALGRITPDSIYAVTFLPWGYGPADRRGQTVAIGVTKATPRSEAPDLPSLLRSPLLCVMDAEHGGDVAIGGAHTGTLTFVADGTRLVPVLSRVKFPTP